MEKGGPYMKLFIAITVFAVCYILAMKKALVEYKTTTRQTRKELQTVPLMVSETIFFLVLAIQTIRLSLMGVLPLL